MNLRAPSLLLLCLLLLSAVTAMAQSPPPGTPPLAPVENVRIEYAQVLRVQPIYQTLRASGSEEVCDPDPLAPMPTPDQMHAKEEGAFSRMMGSIRGFFSRDASELQSPSAAPQSSTPATAGNRRNCRIVQVQRELQRPVAYDIDYIFGGTKYRSRLAEDPGNRIRIRVTVTPDYPVALDSLQ